MIKPHGISKTDRISLYLKHEASQDWLYVRSGTEAELELEGATTRYAEVDYQGHRDSHLVTAFRVVKERRVGNRWLAREVLVYREMKD